MNKNNVHNIAYNVIHQKQAGCGWAHRQLGKIFNCGILKIFAVAQNVKYALNQQRIKMFDKPSFGKPKEKQNKSSKAMPVIRFSTLHVKTHISREPL